MNIPFTLLCFLIIVHLDGYQGIKYFVSQLPFIRPNGNCFNLVWHDDKLLANMHKRFVWFH